MTTNAMRPNHPRLAQALAVSAKSPAARERSELARGSTTDRGGAGKRDAEVTTNAMSARAKSPAARERSELARGSTTDPSGARVLEEIRLAGWVHVCRYDQLVPERGVAALVDGRQVALFRTFDGMLHAIDNRDPFSGAFVLSRGIVGSKGDAPTVASPLFKQIFDLRTGACLSEPDISVAVHEVRCVDGVVELRLTGSP